MNTNPGVISSGNLSHILFRMDQMYPEEVFASLSPIEREEFSLHCAVISNVYSNVKLVIFKMIMERRFNVNAYCKLYAPLHLAVFKENLPHHKTVD